MKNVNKYKYYYLQSAADSVGNCILSTESKTTKPDMYVDETDNVVYFEPKCL